MDNQTLHQNYRVWLLDLLQERKARNGSYSLRAFAQSLGISPASLSQIIAGKRPLTRKTAERIAERLGLSPGERRRFLGQANRIGATSGDDGDSYAMLAEDTFQLISDWHHYAILSLAEIEDNRADYQWIAQALRLPTKSVQSAIERLQRLELLKIEEGRLVRSQRRLTLSKGLSSSAIRSYHRQNLHKAEAALETIDKDKRDMSSITMAVDPARLDEARELIKEFRRRVAELMEDGEKQEVYTLAIQLFPVTELTQY